MDYVKNAQNHIELENTNVRSDNGFGHKWLSQLNLNNHALLHAKDYLDNLLALENPDKDMQEEIVLTKAKIENLRQAIVLLQKAFLDLV